MPNENKQQDKKEQKIVIEKWQPNELPGRAQLREQKIRSEENARKTRREQEIAEKYSRARQEAESNRKIQQMNEDASKKISENLNKLIRDWAQGGKQKALDKEQDAIDRLEAEKKNALEKAKEKLDQEYLSKIEEAKELLERLKSPEETKNRKNQLKIIEEERKAWSARNDDCYKVYNKPETSAPEKADYDKLIKKIENRLKELNQQAEELNEAVSKQQAKLNQLNQKYKEALNKATRTIEVNAKDQIDAHKQRLEQIGKWQYNVDDQNQFVSEVNEKKRSEEQIRSDVKRDFEASKKTDETELLRESNTLKRRHDQALAYYKRVEEMQSTKKLFKASDSDEFNEMIQALRNCGDALLSQELGDEAEEKMARLGAEAYKKCQSYLDQKKRVLFDGRKTEAGSKRREIATELKDMLLAICPMIKKQLDPAKYGWGEENKDNEKADVKQPKKENGSKNEKVAMNFDQLSNKTTESGKKNKNLVVTKNEKGKSAEKPVIKNGKK